MKGAMINFASICSFSAPVLLILYPMSWKYVGRTL